jgi:hypothetical protein
MSISITRYVDIVSGVGGAAVVALRDFNLRAYTDNAALPGNVVASFTDPTDVGNYFGNASVEFKVATNYLGFVSKTISSPRSISFVRRRDAAGSPAAVYGTLSSSFADITALLATNNQLTASFADPTVVANITGLTATGTTKNDLAAMLQTQLRASPAITYSSEEYTPFAAAVVTYDINKDAFVITAPGNSALPDVFQSFQFTGADGTSALVLSTAFGINEATATAVPSFPASTTAPLDTVTADAAENDNFGSFGYISNNTANALTLADVESVAAWNHAQNNKFVYCVGVNTQADALTYYNALKGYSGTCLQIRSATPLNVNDVYQEFSPAEIFGAIDFTQPAASQNFMFYQFDNRRPAITDNTGADVMDAARTNYIGRTQKSGQKIAFYQEGVLMGGSTAAVDLTTYTGEIWLKDSILTVCMNGLLALPTIPANREGRTTVLGLIQGPIDSGLENGVISVGKTLNNLQRAYITQITGNSTAWRQVEDKGYWVDASVESEVVNGVTKYYINYLLVYGKNDQIRKITGRDVLI